MAQKPVIPKSRKTIERAKKPAAKDAVKKVEKAVGARGSTLGKIDSLVNRHLASFRDAEKTLAGAKALVQTYREKYPQLADYIPEGAVERGIHIRENATDESEGFTQVPHPHQVGRAVVRSCWRRPTRLSASECGDVSRNKLAISIAKIVFAREAAQVPE